MVAGTMLQMLQDAAAMQKVQEEAHQVRNQFMLSPPSSTQQLLATNPQTTNLNFPGGTTLIRNIVPQQCLPSELQLMQQNAKKVNIANAFPQQVSIKGPTAEDNSMLYLRTQSTCIPQALPISSSTVIPTNLNALSSAQICSPYSIIPSFQSTGLVDQPTNVLNTHPSQVSCEEVTQVVASSSGLSSDNSLVNVIRGVAEEEHRKTPNQTSHLSNSINEQTLTSSAQLGDVPMGHNNKQIFSHFQGHPVVSGQGQGQTSLPNNSISQQTMPSSYQLSGSKEDTTELINRLTQENSINISKQNQNKVVTVSNSSINQKATPSYNQMMYSLKDVELSQGHQERISKQNQKGVPLRSPSTVQSTVFPVRGPSLKSSVNHPSISISNPVKETTLNRTVDQPLTFFTQTSGLNSTESSPMSKKAEDCISSFCSISQQCGAQVTNQNSTCTSTDVSNSNRRSPSLTRRTDSKTKCKNKKDFNKKTGSGAELRSGKSSDEVDSRVSPTPCGSSVGQGVEDKESADRHGQKRPASCDLKENKVMIIII